MTTPDSATSPDEVDEAFYLSTNPDVRAAVEAGAIASGAAHYREHGFREGRAPRPPAPFPAFGPDGTPYPPSDLIFLVTHGADPTVFDATGLADLRAVHEALREGDVALPARPRALDWGCGCGRLARHWPALSPGAVLHGCDINERLVGWCRDNLPFGAFATSPFEPPLDYPDASFDLIYGISVLTHLTFEEHHRWMREIWRLLSPGGAAVVTAHGPTMLPTIMNSVREGGPTSAQRLRTTLVDEDAFACIEDEGGSNASGNALTGDMLAKIFHPFEVRFRRPRFGLMGIHDTYVLAKRTAGPLAFHDRLGALDLGGTRCEVALTVELGGQSNVGLLASATGLHYPATVRLGIGPAGSPPVAVSEPRPLPDKVEWTLVDEAFAHLSLSGLPPMRGPVALTFQVESGRRPDGGPPMPLDGASLRLGKAAFF